MASNPLIGTWRFVSWENSSVEGGSVSYPLSREARGYIRYNEDGHMFVAIMDPNHLRFAADHIMDATKRKRPEPTKHTSPIAGGAASSEIRWSTTWS